MILRPKAAARQRNLSVPSHITLGTYVVELPQSTGLEQAAFRNSMKIKVKNEENAARQLHWRSP
jgi:hypothetical protein